MTDDQLSFNLADLVTPEYGEHLTIQERFEAFHAANPWVYQALEALAADWLAHGHKRVGVKALFEVIRWQYGRRTADPSSAWRVNNDYSSRYARLLIDRHPEWCDAIEIRALRERVAA
mgnify:CR=1 FL=1